MSDYQATRHWRNCAFPILSGDGDKACNDPPIDGFVQGDQIAGVSKAQRNALHDRLGGLRGIVVRRRLGRARGLIMPPTPSCPPV